MQKVIVVEIVDGNGKKRKKKMKARLQAQLAVAQQNCKKWKKLTMGELVVFLGVFMAMSVVNFKRVSHYFIKFDGWCSPDVITDSMKEEHFHQIMANLTFRDPNADDTGGSDRLSKIRPVVVKLSERAKKGYVMGQHGAIDESMIATSSGGQEAR